MEGTGVSGGSVGDRVLAVVVRAGTLEASVGECRWAVAVREGTLEGLVGDCEWAAVVPAQLSEAGPRYRRERNMPLGEAVVRCCSAAWQQKKVVEAETQRRRSAGMEVGPRILALARLPVLAL